ncbi:hypothetical protein BC939DRAFT_278210 [Gamsiella multidivaricata]|uniref:uncharacterized protein n=1 Tax=Gamsiella multidivaricata TaxID=101098 RepID=UPI00221E7D74|nr:uncharacterized protein BC939DRAFT_278210 [Gamsiella multidivaricata]KAI7818781.1 hypothetical protein BC939DRAFT_278210 [Gamsiella multidivaricata]
MDPTKHQQHPVLDTLEQTRMSQHEGPFPHSATATRGGGGGGLHPLDGVGTDVVDQILQQSEAVPLTKTSTPERPQESHRRKPSSDDYPVSMSPSSSPTQSKVTLDPTTVESSSRDKNMKETKAAVAGTNLSPTLSGMTTATTATQADRSWQSLASMSSNQLPSKAIMDSMERGGAGTGAGHEYEHDKPSVLPEILPGFKGRMADIHHATFKSVAEGSHPSSGGNVLGNDGGDGNGKGLFFFL